MGSSCRELGLPCFCSPPQTSSQSLLIHTQLDRQSIQSIQSKCCRLQEMQRGWDVVVPCQRTMLLATTILHVHTSVMLFE